MTDTRANAIVDLATRLDMVHRVHEVMFDVMDGEADNTELSALIRASFAGDDDFDDMVHEVDHVLGDCADGDDDCPWNDED